MLNREIRFKFLYGFLVGLICLDRIECLCQILDDIIHIFDAD